MTKPTNGYVYMQPNNQFVIGLKRLHVNTLIDPIELDQNGIYSFSNMIERACKHSNGLKTETERTAHLQ